MQSTELLSVTSKVPPLQSSVQLQGYEPSVPMHSRDQEANKAIEGVHQFPKRGGMHSGERRMAVTCVLRHVAHKPLHRHGNDNADTLRSRISRHQIQRFESETRR